jgi:hypothetical protein
MQDSYRETRAEPKERLLRHNHGALKNLSTADEKKSAVLRSEIS